MGQVVKHLSINTFIKIYLIQNCLSYLTKNILKLDLHLIDSSFSWNNNVFRKASGEYFLKHLGIFTLIVRIDLEKDSKNAFLKKQQRFDY